MFVGSVYFASSGKNTFADLCFRLIWIGSNGDMRSSEYMTCLVNLDICNNLV